MSPHGRALLPCLAAGAAALALAPGAAGAAPRDRLLSNELTTTTWAHPVEPWRVLARPRGGARAIARLRLFTEDGFPEVYVLLRRRLDRDGRPWVQLRYPRPPNGTVGWALSAAFGPFHTIHRRLEIDRRRLRAAVYDRRRVLWRAPVGVGKRSTPTPAGRFWAREKMRVPSGTIYGRYAIGTSAYSRLSDWPGGGVVGIHGTNLPWLIPGRPSHGCIRVRNPAMARLYRLLPIGAPIRIR